MSSSIGPIVLDVVGLELDAVECELLQHPLVGGVIFFARNFESPEQIAELCRKIRAVRKQPILLTVDQEGGRIQRFRHGFTPLPSMGQIGSLYLETPAKAMQLATTCGWLMAVELVAVGLDLSFAPVLDLNKNVSTVIGDRAFHRQPEIVISLATAFIKGMREAGMAAVGKHFPGHGSVTVDSHVALPRDERSFKQIAADDLIPFQALIKQGIEGIMAAHILFPAVDSLPVGFSPYWLQTVLRKKLQFEGMIFSDALDMHGADVAGGFPERVQTALEAGCDMALICNNRESVIKTLDGLPTTYRPVSKQKINTLMANAQSISTPLKSSREWQEKVIICTQLMELYQREE